MIIDQVTLKYPPKKIMGKILEKGYSIVKRMGKFYLLKKNDTIVIIFKKDVGVLQGDVELLDYLEDLKLTI